MPDISMCRNESCSIKEECYRYKAIPNEFRQSYSSFSQEEDGSCKHKMIIYKKEDNGESK